MVDAFQGPGIKVLESPPKESFSIIVSLEFR